MTLIHTPKLRKESHIDSPSRSQLIEDCKVLLTSLPEGNYSMDWYGDFPKFKIHEDEMHDNGIMTISIQYKIKFSRMLQLKIPFKMRKIEICDNDLKCIESWNEEQIYELSSRLGDIINGTYYY